MDTARFCIQPNPDISGDGIRIAIYVQNLLSFAPAAIALWDGKVTVDELNEMKGHSVGLLAIAFAILITTIIQAKSPAGGINGFHAAVVLDLSWMNNTTTFIWFLLYAYHRGQKSNEHKFPIPATFSAWGEELFSPVRQIFAHSADGREVGVKNSKPTVTGKGPSWTNAIIPPLCRAFSANIVLFLGSVHLSLMAAIGIWLWSNPTQLGVTLPCNPSLAIVGADIGISSPALRAFSLLLYSLFLIPGVNLVIPFIFFLTPHIIYNRIRLRPNRKSDMEATAGAEGKAGEDSLPGMQLVPLASHAQQPQAGNGDNAESASNSVEPHPTSLPGEESKLSTNHHMQPVSIRGDPGDSACVPGSQEARPAFLYGGLGFLLLVNVIFILDIELTLSRNEHLHQEVEETWGFGQILALLLLVVPIRDFVSSVLRIRSLTAERKRRDEVFKEETQKRFDILVRQAVGQDIPNLDGYGFMSLLQQGVNPNIIVRQRIDGRQSQYVTLLQLASRVGDLEMVQKLMKSQAELDAISPQGTALRIAVASHHVQIVRILIESGADLNLAGLSGSALQTAAQEGHKQIVQLLLESGADPNFAGSWGSALHAAAEYGQEQIVSMLLDAGADPNLAGSRGSALHGAAQHGYKQIVRILLESGADPNLTGSWGSALHAVAENGNEEIVQILVESGADPNLTDNKDRTALHACVAGSLWHGRALDVMNIILDHGADINHIHPNDGTALMLAASYRKYQIVEVLLAHGADPNITGTEWHTVLQAACSGRVQGWTLDHRPESPGSEALKVVQLLLEAGADPRVHGGNHGSALSLAIENDFQETAKLLRARLEELGA